MQLKIRRSQRDGGIISKTAIFCLDARVHFTEDEARSISRHKLANQMIYNSEASQRLQDKADHQRDGSMAGSLKSLASVALAHMKLNISIASLERGQHVECKSLDELLGAEEAIMTACQNLKGYLDTAATFDGREVLFDFATGQAQAVAQAVTPAPMLIQAPTVPIEVSAQPASSIEPPSESLLPPIQQSQPTDYETPEYGENLAHHRSQNTISIDWTNPVVQKRVKIGLAVIFALFLLHSCHIL